MNTRVAYFSMDTGIKNDLLTYSGGLGILAGDIAKEVMDQGIEKHPMTFLHILWKKGYCLQRLENGTVVDEEPKNNNWQTYVEDTGKKVSVKIFGRDVFLKIWKLKEGPVYYLDSDLPENGEFCNITHHLYGGAWNNREEERVAQEIVLGVGGVRALDELGIEVDAYHYNDGHPAFAGIELISRRMKWLRVNKPGLKEDEYFKEALSYVKKRTGFTTHTNVPAGNESHPISLLEKVGANLDLSYDQMKQIGEEPFGMTVASLRLSSKANGVSRIQVKAAKEMWSWVEGAPDIVAITNGVHKPTWQNKEIGEAFLQNSIHGIYQAHEACKENLIQEIQERTGVQFKKDKIIIAFARRATEYKRWDLVFQLEEEIEALFKKYDVQFVFAGKSHRHDGSGKYFISKIYQLSKKYPQHVVFLEGYDIALAQILVSGADVWLNNPRVPLEACGTSGMKAAMNGVINCTTPDGWAREGCIHGVNSFLIGKDMPEELIGNNEKQDAYDAKSLIDVLRFELLPTFYQDKTSWRAMMYAAIVMSHQYTTTRMLEEYYINMYNYLG